MKNLKNIELETNSNLATLWLNRPEKRNALNITTIEEIIKTFRWLEKQKEVAVIVLRGKGKSFCAGADINWMIESGKSGSKNCFDDSRILAKCFHQVYKSDKAVINLVHGDIFGGGVGLIGAADFTLALRNSRFSLPELQLGLVPSVIMPYLLNRVSQKDLRYQIYTGEIFTAEEAYGKGLIDMICEDFDDMEEKANEIIGNISRGSQAALAETKQLFRRLNKSLINSGNIRKTVSTISRLKMSEDARERMSRFISG